MSTMVGSPVAELSPAPGAETAPPLQAAAAVASVLGATQVRPFRRFMDRLVAAYAYGILAFGVFFPFLLMAWYAVFKPATE